MQPSFPTKSLLDQTPVLRIEVFPVKRPADVCLRGRRGTCSEVQGPESNPTTAQTYSVTRGPVLGENLSIGLDSVCQNVGHIRIKSFNEKNK